MCFFDYYFHKKLPQIAANINARIHIARNILAAFVGEGVGVGVG